MHVSKTYPTKNCLGNGKYYIGVAYILIITAYCLCCLFKIKLKRMIIIRSAIEIPTLSIDICAVSFYHYSIVRQASEQAWRHCLCSPYKSIIHKMRPKHKNKIADEYANVGLMPEQNIDCMYCFIL